MQALRLSTATVLAILFVATTSAVVWADDSTLPTIEIFTTEDRPVAISERVHRRAATIMLYHVDGLERFEAHLSRQLPRERAAAEAEALRRLQKLDPIVLQSAQDAALGLSKASQYVIDRSPAIVLDGHAVVYGITDLHDALDRYHAWQRVAQ